MRDSLGLQSVRYGRLELAGGSSRERLYDLLGPPRAGHVDVRFRYARAASRII